MTITIKPKDEAGYNVSPRGMKDGRAYKHKNGTIYIANYAGEVVAFSVCGTAYIHDELDDLDAHDYKEIHLTIIEE